MLVQGDFSLDSVQMYSGSFKEALKQTMLSQEVMFKKQVLELHRLYGVQGILMQDFSFEEFDRCSFTKAGIKRTLMPYANPASYDPLMKKIEVSSIRTLDMRPAKNDKLRRSSLNLQLPADQYVSLIDLEELDLSLDLGMWHREKGSDEEVILHKKSRRMLSEEVIDLEDSSDGDAETVYSLDLNVPKIQCTEFENGHGHISNDNLPNNDEQFGFYEAGFLDLNEAQTDDSSCHSNDLIVTRYSTSSPSPGFKEKNNYTTESSTLEQDANLDVMMDCGSRNERTQTQTTEFEFKGTNIGEMCNSHCDEAPMESIVNFSKDFNNSRDDESTNLKAVIEPPADKHARLEKSEVRSDCSHAPEDGCDSVLTVSSVSTCNAVNESSREKKVQSSSLPMSQKEQDHRFSGSTESEHDEESSEIELLLQNAVESLICMSLADSSFTRDCNTKTESNEMKTDQLDQPQHSSDSYELLVLNQEENSEDDELSVSSRLSEVTDMDNINFGVKLRRGRRMKDFQREILPGLSCLSRHEICEDINIMKAALRSREYRKNRAKLQDGQKGCAASKSKRSRLNTARRRIIL